VVQPCHSIEKGRSKEKGPDAEIFFTVFTLASERNAGILLSILRENW